MVLAWPETPGRSEADEVRRHSCLHLGMPGLSKWQIGDAISKFFRLAACQQELQVVGQTAQADSLLGGEDDAEERTALALSIRRDSQKVLILCEKDASQLGRPCEQDLVVLRVGPIVLAGEDIESPASERLGHDDRHMDVHIEGQRHAHASRAARRRSSSDREFGCAAASLSAAAAASCISPTRRSRWS